MKLTQDYVDALVADGRDRLVMDDRLTGFGVRITPTGAKIFIAQARVAGRKRRLTVAIHPDKTLAKARDEARQMLADMRHGSDPVVERKARVQAAIAGQMTIAELADKWMADIIVPKRKPRTHADYKVIFEKKIKPKLGHLTVAGLTHDEVNRFHVSMAKTPRRANYVIATLRALINFGIKLKLRPPADNPASGVQAYKEYAREHFLTEAEIGKGADAIDQAERDGVIGPHAAAGLRLAILTGMRSGEITAVEWRHVNWELKQIRLQDSDEPGRKTGARTVYLSEAALEVLKTVPRIGKFVIAGALPDQPYKNLRRAWEKARAYVGLEATRLHDLRHSYASLAAANGASLLMIGKLLGHRVTATTARYSHLTLDAASAVSDQLGTKMTASIERAKAESRPGNVVKLKQPRRQRARS
jgi:integrase